jgi:hypothetical protein
MNVYDKEEEHKAIMENGGECDDDDTNDIGSVEKHYIDSNQSEKHYACTSDILIISGHGNTPSRSEIGCSETSITTNEQQQQHDNVKNFNTKGKDQKQRKRKRKKQSKSQSSSNSQTTNHTNDCTGPQCCAGFIECLCSCLYLCTFIFA